MIIKDIKIIDLLDDSRGVAKKDNKVFFVKNAIYGEKLDAKILRENKNYTECIKIKTTKDSPYYVKPPCPFFDRCGGCSLMNIDYETQLSLKKKNVIKQFEKIAKVKLKDVKIHRSIPFNYRNKITLKVDHDNKIGFNERYSHKVVDIDLCYIAQERINEELPYIRKFVTLLNEKSPQLVKEISVRFDSKDIFFILKTTKRTKEVINLIKTNADKNLNLKVVFNKKEIYTQGKSQMTFDYEEYNYQVSPVSFYQVNTYVYKKLYNRAKELLNLRQEDKLLDLYCGCGGSSISLKNKNITGVEINPDSIKNANKNGRINKIENFQFIKTDSNKIDRKFITSLKPDAISIDPPRAGISKTLAKEIIQSNVNKILYISCNVSTLCRDLREFINEGYKINKVEIFDMFAQTMHVECVCLLSREK